MELGTRADLQSPESGPSHEPAVYKYGVNKRPPTMPSRECLEIKLQMRIGDIDAVHKADIHPATINPLPDDAVRRQW